MTTAQLPIPPKLIPLFSNYSRYKIAHGGRGSGKTRTFALMTAVRAHMWAVAGEKGTILCAREFQVSLQKSSFAEVKAAIQSVPWLEANFEIGKEFIRHKSGNVDYAFEGLRHNIESLKGIARILLVWVDEAETVDAAAWRTLIPTVRSPGSEIWVTYNPANENSATNQRFRIQATDRMQVVEVNHSDNPWFPQELDDERMDDMQTRPLDYAHVWEGAYRTRDDSRVFTNWRIEEFDSPSDAIFRFGADWGFSVDPSVLIRGYLKGPKKLYIDHEAWEVGCEVDATPALFDRVPRSREFRITADNSRPELVAYMRRHGFPKIVPAVKGAGSIEDGISFLQSFEIIIHPRCKNVAREVASYAYKVDRRTEEILPILEDKDNHTIDALRYALEGLRRAGPLETAALETKPIDRYARLREQRSEDDAGLYG